MLNLKLLSFLLIIPWAATFLGSIIAVQIPTKSKSKQGLLLGFAAGVMLASTVWSLLIPAFEYSGNDIKGILVVTLGFVIGCGLMLVLDKTLPHQHSDTSEPEGTKTKLPRQMLLVLAVALHNIPEGMALGVVLAAAMQPGYMTWAMAISFAIGLALQNFPEGMAVVLPLKETGMSKKKILTWGIVASFAEPFSAVIGMILSFYLASLGDVLMPILLSSAAGAMAFVIVEELIPESQANSSGHLPTYGFLSGFWIMAVIGVFAG